MNYIDLHTHTNASDGSLSPEALVRYAIRKNICALAITDHDTTAGLEAAFAEADFINAQARKDGTANTLLGKWCLEQVGVPVIRIIPGVELSSRHNGKDAHILGYGIDYKNPDFQKRLASINEDRKKRNQEMVKRINEIGCSITPEELKERFGDAVITRAHYAICMVEKGFVKNKDEAFQKYLNPGCACYLPKQTISSKEAIDLILSIGGYPVLAHPLMYKLSMPQVEQLVADMASYGVLGVEAIYSANKWNDEMKIRQLAKRHNLFITGGTDYHGIAKPTLDLGVGYGDMKIPVKILKNTPFYQNL